MRGPLVEGWVDAVVWEKTLFGTPCIRWGRKRTREEYGLYVLAREPISILFWLQSIYRLLCPSICKYVHVCMFACLISQLSQLAKRLSLLGAHVNSTVTSIGIRSGYMFVLKDFSANPRSVYTKEVGTLISCLLTYTYIDSIIRPSDCLKILYFSI